LSPLSITEYTIVYVPAIEESAVPEVVIEEVISPSILSVAVAPGSVKAVPNSIVIVASPINDITGAIVSSTVMVLVAEAELSEESKTVYTMVYVPSIEVSTVPEVVIEEVISPSSSSSAVAPGSVKVTPASR